MNLAILPLLIAALGAVIFLATKNGAKEIGRALLWSGIFWLVGVAAAWKILHIG